MYCYYALPWVLISFRSVKQSGTIFFLNSHPIDTNVIAYCYKIPHACVHYDIHFFEIRIASMPEFHQVTQMGDDSITFHPTVVLDPAVV